MHNTFNQLSNPTGLSNLIYNLTFLGGYNFEYISPTSFSEKVDNDLKNGSFNRILAENNYNEEYTSQPKMNIILNTKTSRINKELKISKITEPDEETTKVPRKPSQKETRNVSSNLMRVFLKNLIELKIHSKKIRSISARFNNNFPQEQFYQWIQRFGINFKNYIRSSQISKIIDKQEPQCFRKTFLILLDYFSKEIGVQHCLTSKRIERNSVKMHLIGLRNILIDLLKQS